MGDYNLPTINPARKDARATAKHIERYRRPLELAMASSARSLERLLLSGTWGLQRSVSLSAQNALSSQVEAADLGQPRLHPSQSVQRK